MKVALVYPRYKWYEYNGLAEPIGVLHLVSALREAGHEPVYLDYSFCSQLNELDHLAEGAGIIAVAISAAAKLERASVVTEHLKKVVPEALFLVGGAYPSIFPKQIWARYRDPQYVVGCRTACHYSKLRTPFLKHCRENL